MSTSNQQAGGRGPRAYSATVVLTLAVVLGSLPRPAAANSPPQVSAVRAIPFGPVADQRVLVRFDLADADGDELHVSLQLFGNNGSTFLTQCTNTDPPPGAAFTVGADRTIIWNAQAEYPSHTGSEYVLKVIADDGFVATPEGFVLIPPGTFMMGSPTTELLRNTNETQHQVTLTHGVYVQATEVTNQQYRDMAQWAYNNGYVTATTSGLYDNLDGSTQFLKGLGAGGYEITFSAGVFSCINPTHPVKYVTWYGSVAYCDWLSLQQNLPRAYNHSTWQCNGDIPYTSPGYRLPTEAEWEYACRAGSTTAFANGPITNAICTPLDPNLNLMGWYCGNAGSWTHPVAQKTPSAWGLFDMHGNLWEWCNDWFGTYGGTVTNPVGAGPGSYRVLRGGAWYGYAVSCRSAVRLTGSPTYFDRGVGFRPVRPVF